MKHIRSMSLQLLRLLALAGLCAVLLLSLLRFSSDRPIGACFPGSVLQQRMIEKRIEAFGDYISSHDISATDTAALLHWCEKQPLVLMEIYRGNVLYFNSDYDAADPLNEQNIEAPRYDWYALLRRTTPRWAAETVASAEDVAPELIKRLKKLGTALYCTADGPVFISWDGSELAVAQTP